MTPSGPEAMQLLELHTRFLFPFHLGRDAVRPAFAELAKATIVGRPAWEAIPAPAFYQDEVLDHVGAFLFSGADGAPTGYLRVPSDTSNVLMPSRTIVEMPDHSTLPIRLDARVGIELFLSTHGVGILSVPLRLEGDRLTAATALDFNYRVGRRHPMPALELRVPHPKDDPERWARISPADRAKIREAPPQEAPVTERLGVAGGAFALVELMRELLQPLRELGLVPVQQGLCAYTVARFGRDVDFSLPSVRETHGPLLAGLAQVEEARHAGAPADQLGVANAILNRRHWGAVGLLGAAHLVADQPPDDRGEHAFNEQRVPRVRDKYFVPYLMALSQRLFLNRLVRDARRVAERDQKAEEIAAGLRDDLLRFSLEGQFSQVSEREALHRFYRIAQQGLDVREAWDEVRQALADNDAQFTLKRQEDQAATTQAILKMASQHLQTSAKSLSVVASIQRKVEWIEVFVISVYAGELWHLVAGENEPLKELVLHHLPLPEPVPEIFAQSGTFVVAAIAFVVALLLLRPWSDPEHH